MSKKEILKRLKTKGKSKKDRTEDNYFVSEKDNLQCIKTGCTLLDLVLGGGFPLGRISNIGGAQSTGKSLLCIEVMANFYRQFPEGKMFYIDAEAAFDIPYAEQLGLPSENVDLAEDVYTVESLFKHLHKVLDSLDDKPCLYIVDSLDALEVSEESKSVVDEAGFSGARKASKMSEMFRKLTSKICKTNTHLLIVSQLRDKIGVTFGEKRSRSGGKALDYYASQIVWLNEKKKIREEKKGVKRVTGVEIVAKNRKNKVGLPYRECDFNIIFGYGIDSISANLKFLKDSNKLEELDLQKTRLKKIADELKAGNDSKLVAKIEKKVVENWNQVELSFLPKYKKY